MKKQEFTKKEILAGLAASNFTGVENRSPLIALMAWRDSTLEEVKDILIEDPSQLNSTDTRDDNCLGYNALHYACWDGKSDIAQFLIEKGIDIHAAGVKDCATPLTLLAFGKEQRHIECLLLLIESGINLDEPRLIDHNPFHPNGANALRLAVLEQAWKIVDILIENGADLNILKEPCTDETYGVVDFFENVRKAGISHPERNRPDRINELKKKVNCQNQ